MRWTEEKIAILRERYPNENNKSLAQFFGCSKSALGFRASRLGLTKSADYMEARYNISSKAGSRVSLDGERRQIATGTVIIRGNVLTHISNMGMSRGQAPSGTHDDA